LTNTISRHRAGQTGGSATAATAADAELLVEVRAGDSAAFGVLYDRHSAAARRLARVLVRDPSDAEDLVAEAFAKVLAALRLGRGPEVAFRAYLLTAVRHACYDRTRRDRRIEFTEDLTRYETVGGPTAGDQTVARLDRWYAARAFARLPERWQVVLWHTEVEGEKPATIAPMLGLSPNAVATLAYRARERLRQMYLQEHLTASEDPSCHWTSGRLGAHVRHGLPCRERSKVDAHLTGCDDCRARWAELAEINSGLRGVLGPVVLGPAATPYLAAVSVIARWPGVAAAVRDGWSAALDLVRAPARRHGPANAAQLSVIGQWQFGQ
jgi:RNA polymerase sigma factor (sigma-70 family)